MLRSAVVFASFAKEVPATLWNQGRLPPAIAQAGNFIAVNLKQKLLKTPGQADVFRAVRRNMPKSVHSCAAVDKRAGLFY